MWQNFAVRDSQMKKVNNNTLAMWELILKEKGKHTCIVTFFALHKLNLHLEASKGQLWNVWERHKRNIFQNKVWVIKGKNSVFFVITWSS